jgi:hypothetical protein
MSHLVIVYDGKTVYERDVESFSLEANAKGDLFVAASMEAGPEPDQHGESIEGLVDDDRLSPFERSILTKRLANGG